MIRHSFVLGFLVMLSACFESHGASDNVVRNTDCYTCHQPQYEAAGVATKPQIYVGSPFHNTNDAKACSKDCVQCHATQDWSNFMGGCVHPEGVAMVAGGFPLVSQGTRHTNLKCLDCHSEAISVALGVTAKAGANTDCIACHPNTTAMANNHVGVSYDAGAKAGQAYAYSTTEHHFCLDCHPKGLAAGHNAQNPFILPHGGATCAQCHDNTNTMGLKHDGGADVLCTKACHQNVCSNHDNGCGSNPNGYHPSCLNSGCHWDGRKHGG